MLKGFVCPRDGRKVSFAYCLDAKHRDCCMDTPMKLAMIMQEFKHPKGMSVTNLTGCVRKSVWEATRDYHKDPRLMYYALRGSMFHYVLAANHMNCLIGTLDKETLGKFVDKRMNILVEKRFEKDVAGYKLSGGLDAFDTETGTLHEFKTFADGGESFILKKGAKAEHEIQVQIYDWLVRPEYNVKRIRIHYLMMKKWITTGNSYQITERKGRSKGKEVIYNIPLVKQKTDDEVEAFLKPKVLEYQNGIEGKTPKASKDKKWLFGFCPFIKECKKEG